MKQKEIFQNRITIISFLIIIFFLIIILKLFNLQIKNHEKSKIILEEEYITTTESNSTPRGRIYDRNGILLVDNKPVKTISYKKQDGITKKDEIDIAYKLISVLKIENKITTLELKKFMLLKYKDLGPSKITKEELKLLNERKLTYEDLERYKIERITEEEMNYLNKDDKLAAYIFTLMNKGYSYDEKIIKNKDVTDYEYAYIFENKNELKGFNVKLEWERVYIYGNTLKSIFGNIANGIPKDKKDYYLALGYKLNDKVGISGLEYEYEKYLKGEKEIYKLKRNNEYEIIKEGKKGNDLYLTIDINLQLEIDNIIENEMLYEKTLETSTYYDSSFVIITKPTSGEVLAISGKKAYLEGDTYKVIDNTKSIINNPVTAGSVIKGASMAVGYKYKAIDIGTTLFDTCIKIKNTKEKCSYRKGLGNLDDINALVWSSNSYQYQTAIKVANASYFYDAPLIIDSSAFNKYRNMYNSFGLGVKTGIDYPSEGSGYKGNSFKSGLLLDFAIGQYDTYTPLQISQYINTLATKGYRITPKLVNKVKNNDELIFENKVNIKNKVDLEEVYFNRIIEGFKAVMDGPLGRGYASYVPNTAGKTGTSQSFIDTNNDGIIDTATITNTFALFYPYYDPKISITVISPNVLSGETDEISRVNRRITVRSLEETYKRYKY